MASLQVLEEEAEGFCRASAQALAEAATGHAPKADLAAVERAHPLLVSPDTVAAVEAAVHSPRTRAVHRARLAALLPFLRRVAVEAEARPAEEALQTALLSSTVRTAGEVHPLLKAWAAVAEETDTARRRALARATADAELALLGAVQRRWEAVQTATRSLGVPASPPAAGLLAEARDFLKTTEDGWRDVLGYACRKLSPELRPLPGGDAGYEVLLRLVDSPLPGAFPPAECLPALRRWLAASGLTLEAEGRVRLDERGAGGLPEAACFLVEVPERVLLVLPPRGHGSFPALLEAAGRARAAASVPASAPFGARRLGDASVGASAGALFRNVLTSAPWLRRFFSLGKAPAREVARLAALARLGELRAASARLSWAATQADVGPSLPQLKGLAATLTEALCLDVPLGAVLPGFMGSPREAETLQAAALAECLEASADERFDAEDFRNPSAARWLATVWARGAELDAGALAKELGGALSLAAVGRRLLTVLGA